MNLLILHNESKVYGLGGWASFALEMLNVI